MTMLATAPIRVRAHRKASEDGYILLGVVILLALFVVAMAVAAPRVAKELQRDRELEAMHRGKQYIRGIQLYYRKFHAYPPNIEALVKTNEIRFVRKRYKDPLTGKDDWKPIAFGQNKAPIAMGFFGQPLGGTGGSVLAGTGPSGGNGIGTGLFGSTNGTSPVSTSTGGLTTPGSTTSGTDSSSNSGLTGQTFGGGGMIGVSPASTKQSMLVYKKMSRYNEWEFTYSPLMEMQTMTTGSALPTGTSSPTSPTTPTTTTTPF